MSQNHSRIAPEVRAVYEDLCLRAANSPNDIEVLINVGVYLFLLDCYPHESQLYLKKAIEIDPTNVDAYFWLALCIYYSTCDYEMARELLYKAIKLAPQRADCLSLLASVIQGIEGPTQECLDFLRSAIKLAPDWTLPRQVLIQIYTWEGEFILAEKELQKLATVVQNMGDRDIEVKNDIEDYYERCVTGRLTIAYNIEALEKQTEELNRARLGVTSKDKDTTAVS